MTQKFPFNDFYILLYFNGLAGQWESATPNFLTSRIKVERMYDQFLEDGFTPRDLKIVHEI